MKTVAILGSSGMLGSALVRLFQEQGLDVIEFNRTGSATSNSNKCFRINIEDKIKLSESILESNAEYFVNAVGLIKQKIDENSAKDRHSAVLANSNFPATLNLLSQKIGFKLIQIGTDCVYSGAEGQYSENSDFDPVDTYGTTKHEGEQASPQTMIIRSSIIGREEKSRFSLMEWLLGHPGYSEINGYVNHFWNGVTTLHFAKIALGVIETGSFEEGIFHLIPSDTVCKFDLLEMIAKQFSRRDLKINPIDAPLAIDRTLGTVNPGKNAILWNNAGYTKVPSIEEMVAEYAEWTYKLLGNTRK
jgi:dTDP-4-dehydrorhamnose reductase